MRIVIFLLLVSNLVFSQDERTWIRGKVLYKNINVVSANVVNNTSGQATITNEDGEFEMKVRLNDRLVFSSVQYEIRSTTIDKDILQKSRLVIDVNEKVTILDEVVVGPENTEKFLDLKKEEFKRVDYIADKSTRIKNEILKAGTFNNGLNFINLYKAIAKSSNKVELDKKNINSLKYKPSDLIREVYDDSFFVTTLGIKKDNISEFLLYCNDRFPSKVLFKKSNEFQLIDFLINQSEKFKKILEKN
ncbi:MAG: carboxypeptidase-like regulatory domain-containing protein [Flavobacteriaceae bacterium]|nr:carboxypeptidase-like regulatory domain-containing protein [Flavobacteriaceae bacterium]